MVKKCNHKNCIHLQENIISGGYNIPQGFIEEFDVVCSRCNEIIGHWAYGSFDIDYILKYELKGFKKLFANIKYLWDYKVKLKMKGLIK